METDPDAVDIELEPATEEALEGEPRAVELLKMKRALEGRRQMIADELPTIDDPVDRARLEKMLEELEEQIRVLSEEANITQFIEDAVRVGVEMRKLQM